MGGGRWSSVSYDAGVTHRTMTGKSFFDYNDSGLARRSGVHKDLNPLSVTRESRDSDEHPESLAVAVLFDVTGSMGSVPRKLVEKLPALFGLLVDKRYAKDPQVLFGAIGDATCDRVPLQIGQFESDNRAEKYLGKVFIEGGGGGQMTESYELAMYFMARHTSIDCYEKRGRRGYLFIIGDEMPYSAVSRSQVTTFVGDTMTDTLTIAQMVEELKRKYHVYYILPAGSSYVGNKDVLDTWRGLLRQNVIELADLDAVSETIALTIGLSEGTVDLDTGLKDLKDYGSTAGDVVGKALATVGRALVPSGPALVPATSDGDEVERL